MAASANQHQSNGNNNGNTNGAAPPENDASVTSNGGVVTENHGSTRKCALRHNPGLCVLWTTEEQSILEDLLIQYASEDLLVRYARISQALKAKTVRDVALRCRWMNKKENGKRRKDGSSRKNKDKKEKVTDSVPKSSQVANRSNGPPYAQAMLSMDSDDGISYQAIGGAAGQLLEQNAQALDQISDNFAALKFNDNINLFCQARSNILSMINEFADTPEIMKSMPPLPVKLNAELYGRGGANVWNFILSAPNTNVYVGMGFSPNANGNMVGSRAVVGWVARDGTLAIRKYYLGGQEVNLVRVEPPEQGLQVANSSIFLQSNRIYMVFQVISDTPTTRLIYALGPNRFVPSGTNEQLAEHQDMISTVLNYATGQFQTQGIPGAALRRSHGLLNMFGWCFFLTIGAMVARYMRHLDPMWFYSHALIQLAGFILGLSGIICGFVLEKRINASVSAHKGIGIFILALGCLQLMAFLIRPDKEAKIRKYWNWYHWGVGRVLLLFSVVNVSYGIHLANAGTSWNIGFAIALIILFLIAVVLEVKLYRRK